MNSVGLLQLSVKFGSHVVVCEIGENVPLPLWKMVEKWPKPPLKSHLVGKMVKMGLHHFHGKIPQKIICNKNTSKCPNSVKINISHSVV